MAPKAALTNHSEGSCSPARHEAISPGMEVIVNVARILSWLFVACLDSEAVISNAQMKRIFSRIKRSDSVWVKCSLSDDHRVIVRTWASSGLEIWDSAAIGQLTALPFSVISPSNLDLTGEQAAAGRG